jgi:DNA-binding transcriptional LysR family regulator
VTLNFHQLRLFYMVAKLRSVSRAAEALHISQPSVSAQLRDFEQRHGVDLLRRTSRGMRLTDAGQTVFGHAKRLFEVADDLQSALTELGSGEGEQLTIGGSLTAGEYYLPAVSNLYHQAYPRVRPVLTLDNSNGILARIARREFDLGFVGTTRVGSNLVATPCWRDEIVVIAAPNSVPQSQDAALTVSALASRNFVLRELGSGTREQVERSLQAHEIAVDAAMTVGSPEAVKRHVAAGVGWGFASRRSIVTELSAGQLAVIEVEGWCCVRDFCAVHHRSHSLTSAQARFLEIAKTFDRKTGG